MSSHFALNDSLYVNASSGKVGVGITNPSKTFEVVGDIDSTTDYNINGTQVLSATTLGSAVVNSSLTSNTGNLTNTGTLTVSSTSSSPLSLLNASMNDGTSQWVHFGKALSNNDSAALGFEYSSGSSAQLRLGFYGNASDLLVVQEDGNIGIGTDAPSGVGNKVLHLHQNSAGGNNWLQFTDTDTGATATDGFIIGIDSAETAQVRNRENTDLSFWTNDSQRMTIDNEGNVGIGCDPTISLAIGDSDTGFEWIADGKLSLYTNGTERIRFDHLGNVGIGTNNPSSKLEVNGNIIADSTLHSSNTLNKTSGPSGIFFAKVQTNGTDINIPANEMTTRNDTSAPNCVVWNVNDAQWGRSNISKSTIDTNTYDLLGSNSTSSNLGSGTCIRIKITGLYEISFSIPTHTDQERANPCISVGIADSVNSTATGAYYDTRMYASNGYIRDTDGNNRSVQVLPPIILQLNQNQGIQVRGRYVSGWGNTGNVHVATDGVSVGYLYIKRIA